MLVQDPILFPLSWHLPTNLGGILQGHRCFLYLQYVLRYYFHCKHYPLSEEILRCQENSKILRTISSNVVDDVSENPFALKCLGMMGKLQEIHIEIPT